MKRLALFAFGFILSALLLIPIARLRQFMLEPDYIGRNNAVRCESGSEKRGWN